VDRVPHKSKRCCICKEPIDVLVGSDGEELWSHGNNAEPVVEGGRCCTSCDQEVVIPTRIQIMLAKKRSAQARADRKEK